MENGALPQVDLSTPRWDQATYWGRAKYFITTTNPLNIFLSNHELERAKEVVESYKAGSPLPGIGIYDVYKAKEKVDSAYHPDTGEKMLLIGRMSAQVPMNMLITGCMITFYRSTPAVIFWQWINQSFNAVVNYTNRSGSSPISGEQLGKSYVMATGGALITALGLNKMLKNAPSIIGRLVPFSAVAAANCINIPLMRQKELIEGIPVYDEDNNLIGNSQKAASQGISAVVFSRVAMSSPGMILTPVIMEYLEKKRFLIKRPWLNCPLQVGICGIFLTFATPLCCALFPQKSSIPIAELEDELKTNYSGSKKLGYYNKGL